MMYVARALTVLFWVIAPYSQTFAAGPPVSCECPKLACEPCSIERGVTFYSEKCGPKNSKVKSCGRPTCIPIEEVTVACPVLPKTGSGPTEPVVVKPAPGSVPMVAVPVVPKAVGKIRVIQGSVSVVSADGKKVQITTDTPILETETIESGKDGKAVIDFEGGNRLHVHPDTAVEVKEFKEPASDSRKALLNLIKGKIRNQVKQKYDGKSSHYRVTTKAAVAGVRGTDFVMENDEDGAVETRVETISGKVTFGTLGDTQSRDLERGEGARFVADKAGRIGTLSNVYKLSPEAFEKLEADSTVEVAARKQGPRPESAICEKPRGLFNQCAWSRSGGTCVRSRCNANGHWADTITLPAASQDLCPGTGFTVKDCDY